MAGKQQVNLTSLEASLNQAGNEFKLLSKHPLFHMDQYLSHKFREQDVQIGLPFREQDAKISLRFREFEVLFKATIAAQTAELTTQFDHVKQLLESQERARIAE